MSTESEISDESASAEPQKHNGRLHYRKCWQAFAPIMRALVGTDRPSIVARYLGPPVTAQMVRHWRAGNAGLPAWVIETTRQRLAMWQATVDRLTPGPGRTGDIQRKRKTPR
jgi:hypothetical protein